MLELLENSEFKAGITPIFDEFQRKGEVCIEYAQAPVFFMLSQRRESIEIVHVGAVGRAGKLGIRSAAKALVKYVSDCYPWCEMLLAPISIKSLYNTCKKAGFTDYGLMSNEAGTITIMGVNYGRLC